MQLTAQQIFCNRGKRQKEACEAEHESGSEKVFQSGVVFERRVIKAIQKGLTERGAKSGKKPKKARVQEKPHGRTKLFFFASQGIRAGSVKKLLGEGVRGWVGGCEEETAIFEGKQ